MHYADHAATTILMADEHPLIALHPRTLRVHAGAKTFGTRATAASRRRIEGCSGGSRLISWARPPRLALSVRSR